MIKYHAIKVGIHDINKI